MPVMTLSFFSMVLIFDIWLLNKTSLSKLASSTHNAFWNRAEFINNARGAVDLLTSFKRAVVTMVSIVMLYASKCPNSNSVLFYPVKAIFMQQKEGKEKSFRIYWEVSKVQESSLTSGTVQCKVESRYLGGKWKIAGFEIPGQCQLSVTW